MKLAAVLTALAVLGPTVPYVRSHTVTAPDHCQHWLAGPLRVSQSEASAPNLGAAGFAAITRAWQTWDTPMRQCGNLLLEEGPHSASQSIGYDTSGAQNENLVVFRTRRCSDVVPSGDPCFGTGSCGNAYQCWSHSSAELALTTNTYDTSSGRILDADTEMNAVDRVFTAVDGPPCTGVPGPLTCVDTDVQETYTHEFGHVLGLAHSPDGRSTMYASAPRGETSKRVLDDGSQAFVCTVYPAGQPSQDCSAPDPGTGGSSGGCRSAPNGPASLFLPALALLLAFYRRQHRAAPPSTSR